MRRFIASACVTVLAQTAQATEGGGTSKVPGADTVLAGVIAPPGSLRLTSLLGGYTADRTLDSSGHDRPGIDNFHLDASALILRFQYVWPRVVDLWGADIETRVAITAVAHSHVDFNVQQNPSDSAYSRNRAPPGSGCFCEVVVTGEERKPKRDRRIPPAVAGLCKRWPFPSPSTHRASPR